MYRLLVVLAVALSALVAPAATVDTVACAGEFAVEGPGVTAGEPPALETEPTATGTERARTGADDGAPVGAVAVLALSTVALALAAGRGVQKFR